MEVFKGARAPSENFLLHLIIGRSYSRGAEREGAFRLIFEKNIENFPIDLHHAPLEKIKPATHLRLIVVLNVIHFRSTYSYTKSPIIFTLRVFFNDLICHFSYDVQI